MLDLIVDILLISAIIPLLLSVILYSRVPWHNTALGTFFMSYQFSMLLLWAVILLIRHNIFGIDMNLLSNLSLVIFGIVSGLMWWGMFLIRRYTIKEDARIKRGKRRKSRREGKNA